VSSDNGGQKSDRGLVSLPVGHFVGIVQFVLQEGGVSKVVDEVEKMS
jgi:hypothetical protein